MPNKIVLKIISWFDQYNSDSKLFDFISIRVRDDNLMYFFYDDNFAFSFDAYSPEAILYALSCDFDKQNYLENEIFLLEKTKHH